MVKIVLIGYNLASVRMRNPVGMHEAGLSKFTHYLRGKLSAASKENLKQALDTPPGDKGGTEPLWQDNELGDPDPADPHVFGSSGSIS
jgi:hypothetical protein